MEKEIALFSKGVHNLLDAEAIPTEAASDSNNWYTTDGRLKLINGKVIVGVKLHLRECALSIQSIMDEYSLGPGPDRFGARRGWQGSQFPEQ